MDRGNGSNFPKILNQKYDIVVGPGSTHDRVDLVPSWMEFIELVTPLVPFMATKLNLCNYDFKNS